MSKLYPMSTVHTIQLAGGEVGSRKSESRHYAACIVVTVTDESVRIRAGKKVAAEASLVGWTAVLDARLAQHKMTIDQARAWESEASTRWYGQNDDGSFKEGAYTYWTALDQARVELRRDGHDDKLSKRAHEIMVARGFADPHDYEKNPGGIVAAGKVEGLKSALAGWRAPAVGSQEAYSWHASVGNASNAISASALDHVRAAGHRLDIRTDITTRETAKRAKKEAAP